MKKSANFRRLPPKKKEAEQVPVFVPENVNGKKNDQSHYQVEHIALYNM